MAYTLINKSTLHFNTKLYTGNGGTNAQTGVGFQPDWLCVEKKKCDWTYISTIRCRKRC